MAMVILNITLFLWLKLIYCNKHGKCHFGIDQVTSTHFFDPEAVILMWTGNLHHQHTLLLNSHIVFSDIPRQQRNFSFQRMKPYWSHLEGPKKLSDNIGNLFLSLSAQESDHERMRFEMTLGNLGCLKISAHRRSIDLCMAYKFSKWSAH